MNALHLIRQSLVLSSLVLVSCLTAKGQYWTQYDQGTPPQHAAGVSSLGSYVSTEIGTVNLSNGALNIHLPMGTVGGRGFSVPISLNYSSKVWSVAKENTSNFNFSGDVLAAYANYGGEQTYLGLYNPIGGAGWSTGGTPIMKRQFVGAIPCDSGQGYQYVLTKLTAVMPDGSEIEFRDDLYDGAARWIQPCTLYNDVPRGLRWHATDGSGAIFLYDDSSNQTGTLITGDGTRYRFDSTYTPVVSIADRNGNQISINRTVDPNNPAHITVEYVDQLGRSTKAEQNAPDPTNGNVTLALLVTIKGYQGATRYYKVKTEMMGNLIRSDLNYNHQPILTGNTDPYGHCYPGGQPPAANYIFPDSYCQFQQQLDNQPQVSEVDLPDGRSLNFKYNLYGEVAEVVLPTGAKLQYDYSASGGFPSGNTMSYEAQAQVNGVYDTDRAVTQRRTYPDGNTLEATWTYSFGPANCTSYPCVEVKAFAGSSSSGTLLLSQRNYFLTPGRYISQDGYSVVGDGYSLWSTGLKKRTETRDSSGNVISAVERDWTQRAPTNLGAAPWSYSHGEQPANDNRVNETRNYLDNGSFSKTDTFYDNVNYPQANNVSEVWEYDFDQSLKRRSTTSYVTGSYQTNDSIHLLSLPSVQTVFDAGGNQIAQTVNEYDNYGGDGNHAPLQDYGAVVGHDINYGGALTARGNLTAIGRWLNTNNSTIYSYLRYDILGNPVGNKDANGNVTTLSYTDDFGDGSNPGGGGGGAYGATYAFPTLITSPPPQAGQPQQTARSQYDFWSGLLTGFRDRNNVVTQTIYNDPFDRPTQVKSALGISGIESHAAMYYAPATVFGITLTNNDVLTTKDQTTIDDAVLRSWTHTDGFGRTFESWSRDPQGDDKVVTIYDALGRVKQTSNPFRPSLGENAIYTTTAYDLAGRATSITTPDSAVVSTSYYANTVTVTDQAGKQRKSVTDGLGRLIQIYEDPNGLNYLTSYGYDTLDNLTNVTQGTQTPRSFSYDSLKRLTSTWNPESNTVNYQYDSNGNLTQKTDARPVTTTISYDALNRPIAKSYSDGTPVVNYFYDSQGLPNGSPTYPRGYATGRLIASTYGGGSAGDYYGFDAAGRAMLKIQQTSGVNYQMTASYNLASVITGESYPSGRTVNYSYDTAGRTSSFTGYLGDGNQRNYSTEIVYSPFGMTKEKFGTTTPIYIKQLYTPRGQLAEIRAGTTYTDPSDTSWNRGAIINHYSTGYSCWGASCNAADNNGNLMRQEHWIPKVDIPQPTGPGQYDIATQQFDYDSLNRLQDVHEGAAWYQTFHYDRFGNRTIDQGNTSDGIPKPWFGVDIATNRLTAPGGATMQYDNAGNLTYDTTYGSEGYRFYDAENRMTQALGNNQWQYYSYDGDGRRVKRNINGTETRQVYGVGGELLAEYSASGALQKEYGYRNGQLLITATVTAGGWGPPPSYTGPNPLVPGNEIKLENLTELRSAVNQLRQHAGLADYAFTVDPSPQQYQTTVKAEHIRQLRTALEQARTALGLSIGGYEHPTLTENQSWIYAIDFQELRNQVASAWNSGTTGIDIRWLVSDQLGTPRIILHAAGGFATVSRHDYLPFGEELFFGGRTGSNGYTNNDGARQRFTQKERDNETGLDYFGARYYANAQGRFVSADTLVINPALDQPQLWNKYSYSLNNPLVFYDPDGKFPYSITIRSFAPPGSFQGSLFNDDRRGFTTDQDVSSKIRQTFTADPDTANVWGLDTSSSGTTWNGYGPKYGHPVGDISNMESSRDSGGHGTLSLQSSFSGSNPWFGFPMPEAPPIVVRSTISLQENKDAGTLSVSMNISSKAFPATEAMIADKSGTKVFLAGAAAYGGARDLYNRAGPVWKINMTILINGKGQFQGVMFGGKKYSIAEWNQLFTSKKAGPFPRDDLKKL